MPNCRHKEAVCVIGDFWVCKTAGCENGPKPKDDWKTDRTTWKLPPNAKVTRVTINGVPVETHPDDLNYFISWPPSEWDDDAKTPVSR
jgi:hypothetical protein